MGGGASKYKVVHPIDAPTDVGIDVLNAGIMETGGVVGIGKVRTLRTVVYGTSGAVSADGLDDIIDLGENGGSKVVNIDASSRLCSTVTQTHIQMDINISEKSLAPPTSPPTPPVSQQPQQLQLQQPQQQPSATYVYTTKSIGTSTTTYRKSLNEDDGDASEMQCIFGTVTIGLIDQLVYARQVNNDNERYIYGTVIYDKKAKSSINDAFLNVTGFFTIQSLEIARFLNRTNDQLILPQSGQSPEALRPRPLVKAKAVIKLDMWWLADFPSTLPPQQLTSLYNLDVLDDKVFKKPNGKHEVEYYVYGMFTSFPGKGELIFRKGYASVGCLDIAPYVDPVTLRLKLPTISKDLTIMSEDVEDESLVTTAGENGGVLYRCIAEGTSLFRCTLSAGDQVQIASLTDQPVRSRCDDDYLIKVRVLSAKDEYMRGVVDTIAWASVGSFSVTKYFNEVTKELDIEGYRRAYFAAIASE
jgi:hypothetical protein